MDNCTVPPAGWKCTRAAGHDGPCAALPSYMSPGATLWREIDALGGSGDAGHSEALTKVMAILERRGFTEHSEPRPAGDLREALRYPVTAETLNDIVQPIMDRHAEYMGTEQVFFSRKACADMIIDGLAQGARQVLALATHSPAPMAGEVFRDLEREPLAALHRLQHTGVPAAKPKLGGSILQWAADEIATLRAAHPSTQEGGK